MPIYDFICPECAHQDSDVFMQKWQDKRECPMCNAVMEKKPSCFIPDTFPADGIFFEHVSPTGETFHSKQEIKDYAKKHDLQMDYLE